MEYADIIQNIKSIIDEKGMKQVSIAARAGLTPQSLSNILNGRKLLKVEFLPRLAEALGVTVNELFVVKEK